MMEYIDSK
jgi:N-acetylneuraminic acid mutarotase